MLVEAIKEENCGTLWFGYSASINERLLVSTWIQMLVKAEGRPSQIQDGRPL